MMEAKSVKMKLKRVVVVLLVLGLVMGPQVAQTATTDKTGDIDCALKKAPQGVKVDGYFKTGEISNNSAKVVETGREDGTQAVQLTDGGHNELGTIWASDAAKMDLSQDQTVSMWLYTGNKGISSGDGMAFVLQNGGLDASAVDTSDDKHPVPATGETLGVWGYDANSKFSLGKNAPDLAKTGIQKSWALEFDTFANNGLPDSIGDSPEDINQDWQKYFADSAHFANQFDVDIPKMHIASAYPGDAGAYDVSGKSFTWGRWQKHTSHYPYVKLQHQGVIVREKQSYKLLGTGNWQHLTLDWNASSENMKYTFDDKDPDKGTPRKGYSTTVKIDKTKLGLSESDSQKVRWGFTGTTGNDTGNAETNLVIFEQVPSLVSADATASLRDMTSNKDITQVNDFVKVGDRMCLDYHLRYISGREPWENIQAKLELPKNIMFDSAKITYANGNSQNITDLDNANRTGELNQRLDHSLSTTNSTATISLSGKVVSGGKYRPSTGTNSSFTGTNAIVQTHLTGFQINENNQTAMSISMTLTGDGVDKDGLKGGVSLAKPHDVTVTGRILYSGAVAAKGTKLTLQPELNGTAIQTQVVDYDGDAGSFTYRLPANLILSGQSNTLRLYATDSQGHSTNDVTYQIKLSSGSRELSVSPKASFNGDNPIAMRGMAMTLRPDANWHVIVNDTKGKGDHWTLAVSATPFMSKVKQYPADKQRLSADLVYQMDERNQLDIQHASADIYQRETESNQDVVNVADSWDKNKGLLLRVHSDALQGAYYSRITWTLKDVPKV